MIVALDYDEIAKIVYEDDTEYCGALGEIKPTWDDTSSEFKTRIYKAVVANIIKDMSARENHDSWRKEKILQGWSYGAIKDLDKKLHPALVEFEKLSATYKHRRFRFRDGIQRLM